MKVKMVASSSNNDFYPKHLGIVVGVGVGICMGALMQRFYGNHEKKEDDLACVIKGLTDQVSNLNQIISSLRREQSESEKVGPLRNIESHGEDEEDGDVFFDFAPSKDSTDVSFVRESSPHVAKRLKESEELREGSDDNREKSYELLFKLSKENPSNPEILWRLGRSQYDMAMLAGKENKEDSKKLFMKEAIETCKEAVELDDNIASAHKWYGIALGNYVQFVGSQEKIELGYKYKEQIERAIQLNPEDPSAYSLLGRWCFEVSMLPWYLRRIAAAVYGEPPTSTVDEALDYALQAEKLRPNFWKENSLLIAKCYYQKSDYKKTREWLEKADCLPINNEDDVICQKEIANLLLKV